MYAFMHVYIHIEYHARFTNSNTEPVFINVHLLLEKNEKIIFSEMFLNANKNEVLEVVAQSDVNVLHTEVIKSK